MPAPVPLPEQGRVFAIAGAAVAGPHKPAEPRLVEGEERPTCDPLDPNTVIAAAFKAAGLPVPEIHAASPGSTRRVAPGPIIAAALKAAGLVQS